ncbi:MAG: hypothetical protein WBL63_26425 [Candidatus Acidiferrum sp.]
MNHLLQALKILLCAGAIWLFAECAWTVHTLRPRLSVTITNVDRATIAAGAAAGNVEKASRAWQESSKAQSESTLQAMSNVAAAAKQITGLVSRTDESINSSLIPSITKAVNDQNALLGESQKNLQANLVETLKASQQLQKTLADADATIADPAIKESIENLAVATKNASDATGHLSEITAAGERTADYYEKKLTTPAGFLKTFVKVVLELGSQARILFGGI